MIFTWLAAWILLPTTADASSLDPQSIYDDLIEMNMTCGDQDNCRGNRTSDDLRFVNCQCGPVCAQFGTCCLDSKYKNLLLDEDMRRLTLTHPYRAQEAIYMMRVCKPGWDDDSNIKELCESDISIMPDPFVEVHVTDPRTWITYKNYFCFVCNGGETSDSPVLWDFHLFRNINITLGTVAVLQEGGWDLFVAKGKSVYMVLGAPEAIAPRLHWYRPSVISTCAEDWTEARTKEKCEAYIDLVFHMLYDEGYRDRVIFRNPHCAICNHKRLSDLYCTKPSNFHYYGGPPYGFLFVGLFSFEDKVSRCPRNQVFDKYARRCRAVRCGRNQKLVRKACVDKSEPSSNPESSSTHPTPRPLNDVLRKTPPGASITTDMSAQTENPVTEHTTPKNPGESEAVSSPSTTTETSSSFSTTTLSTMRNRRPDAPSGPKASTGRIRPRPPRTRLTRSGSSHSIIIQKNFDRHPLRHVITYEYGN